MDKSAPDRLAVLGGTFDPVHQGHLALARTAMATLSLDEVLFVVAARPPHKPGRRLTPFTHRLAMVRLAIADFPGFTASGVEERRSGPSYSVDTLRQIRNKRAARTKIFFLIGLDAFVDLPSWKDFRLLPQLAELVVVKRPGAKTSVAAAVARIFGPGVRAENQNKWLLPTGGKVREMAMEPWAVSSTLIRQACQENNFAALPPQALCPAVRSYLISHNLYSHH